MPATLEYVGNSGVFPFTAVVSIHVTFSDGSKSRGSGVVIGENDVLTSAHVVDPDRGLTVRSIEVIPGTTNGFEPYGSFFANHVRAKNYVITDDGLGSNAETVNDYAVLTVDGPQPIGSLTGYLGVRANAMQEGTTTVLNMAGFPVGYQNGGPLDMVFSSGNEYLSNGVIRHDYANETGADWAGASGSGMYVFTGQDRFVVGIMATSNTATYIDGRVYQDILAWTRENDEQRLVGNAKSNTLKGGFKDDVLIGKGGRDKLIGGDGNDELSGGKGKDTAKGGDGADRIKGDGGDDRLFGQSGQDKLFGGSGADRLLGGNSGDILKGGGSGDTLIGAAGADTLDGNNGKDVLFGGKGADTFVFNKKSGRDTIMDFQQGTDIVRITSGASDFDDLKLANKAGDVVIAFGDTKVLIEDSRKGQFDNSDFDFG